MDISGRNARTIGLESAQKYNLQEVITYFHRHQAGILRRLYLWREKQILRKALRLAGHPNSILDIPCGAGRFWPLLTEKRNRLIIAADHSPKMLEIAWTIFGPSLASRIKCLETSVFDIDLPESAVDCIFCAHLMNHLGENTERVLLLREFHRVTRDTVILTLWGNAKYKTSFHHQRQAKVNPDERNELQTGVVTSRPEIERELGTVGFEILGIVDFLPFFNHWRAYVLRKNANPVFS